ncbi:hypothetical protein KUTeg_013655 [Tegillarca granosa]|uniref:FLYWCH-type domain-containing protein n=1 Tax=Tegillarca granosa TaxID=220873 RepID=A0ABQ9EUB3_TEGGR|nr:hypothetical protein KUTeg_013655 [Tegillarca granosa]
MADAQVQVKFVPNQRGTPSLVHNGFRYNVKQRRNERTYWVCHIRTCPATVNTLNNLITKFGNHHNHAAEHQSLKVEEIMNKIKKRVHEEISPVLSIYEEEIAKLRTPEWDQEIQQIQAVTEITILQYAAGGKRNVKRRKYRDIDHRLATLKQRLQNGDIDVIRFADSASYILHLD